MQWLTLFKKEVNESWHNKKIIWVPLVFILLTTMDPISYYYLPELIELSGGVPEGTIFELPKMSGEEVIKMSLDQLSMFGTLLICFITMGAIAGERKSGTLEMMLAKPIKATHFITSKWIADYLLIFCSLAIGLSFSWYYISILYSKLAISTMVGILFFYGLWLLLLVSISIFYNSFLPSSGMVIGCTVSTIILMSITNMVLGHKWSMFPNQMSTHLAQFLHDGTITTQLIGTAVITFILSVILILSSIFLFKKAETV